MEQWNKQTTNLLDRLAKNIYVSCKFYNNNDEKNKQQIWTNKSLLLQNYPIHGEVFLAPAIEDKTTFKW